jgi:hypothetical protein
VATSGHLSVRAAARDVASVYRRHWTFLVPAAVVVLLPQALIDGLLDGLQVEGVRSAKDVALLAAVPLTALVNLLGEALYAGLAAAAVLEWRAGRAVPRIPALVRDLPIRRLIAVDLILSVAAAVGFTLLVIPGLVLLTYLGIAPAVVKIEHRGVRDAFRRSALLVQGQFWRVLVIVTGLIVFTEVAMQALTFPFHGVALISVVDLVAEAVLEPFQGLATVVVTVGLIELRGELPPARELSIGRPPQ